MSFANLAQLHPSQHDQLKLAALKMEMDKAEQLRQKWEDLENKNVEQLTALLSNVEQFKKRGNSRLCKTQVVVGDFLFENLWGLVVLAAGTGAVACLGAAVGHQIAPPGDTTITPTITGFVAMAGSFLTGFSCIKTAEKYKESEKVDQRKRLFELLPKFTNSSNSQLNACMQQLYHLGSDEKIPAPFWRRCVTLFKQIDKSVNEFWEQHNRVERQREELNESDLQATQPLEIQTFAQRHQQFVEVSVEATKAGQDTMKKTSGNIIKI